MSDMTILVVGHSPKQITSWMCSKMLEVGDGNYLYHRKAMRLEVFSVEQETTNYVAHVVDWGKHKLLGTRGHGVVWLEGSYDYELINYATLVWARYK